MNRRELIGALAGVAVARPLSAAAQQRDPSQRRLGFLFATSAAGAKAQGILDAFSRGLHEYGWIDGQNAVFEFRYANGKDDALPQLAAELIAWHPDVILTDGTPAAQAAMNLSRSVPIVLGVSNDPVASGLVASLNRPGGNVTGTSLITTELAGRRLQLLSEIVPGLARVAVLSKQTNPSHAQLLQQTQAAAQLLKIEMKTVEAPVPDALDAAFAAIDAWRAQALIVLPDAMFFGQHARVVAFAASAKIPAIFPEKQVAVNGGLIAYGPSVIAGFRRAGFFVDKILRGANPADIPVEVPTTFELVINLKTAKAIGVMVPEKLVATADQVIE